MNALADTHAGPICTGKIVADYVATPEGNRTVAYICMECGKTWNIAAGPAVIGEHPRRQGTA